MTKSTTDPFQAIASADLHPAAMANSEAKVITLLKKDLAAGCDINTVDKFGGNLLIAACDIGKPKIAKFLIDQGINVAYQESTGFKRTALHYAAREGLGTIVQLLVDRGLDVNAPGSNGFTPLLMACDGAGKIDVRGLPGITQLLKSYTKIVELFLAKGATPNAASFEKGHTGLHYCGDKNLPAIAKVLLEHQANPNVRAKEAGISALHFAARHGFIEVMVLLLSHGANVNAKDDYGFTPLHEAADSNQPEAVKLLLAHQADRSIGVDPGFSIYTKKETALDMAKHRNFSAIVQLLSS
ncbi:MAG: ankyrin repeat protein [uncultured bacterium]|nr:MAG: ankyrin repeat protein [uncultured bacterium]HBY73282.1 hypothetical protein [Candidatus Kerfeldbacteria bacterium]